MRRRTSAAQVTLPGSFFFSSANSATALLGYPFTHLVAVNNGATIVSVDPLPPGLLYTATNQLISAVPTLAGRFQIDLLATNTVGPSVGGPPTTMLANSTHG